MSIKHLHFSSNYLHIFGHNISDIKNVENDIIDDVAHIPASILLQLRTESWVSGPTDGGFNTWQAFLFAPKNEWSTVEASIIDLTRPK
jgi:hypothetical protein